MIKTLILFPIFGKPLIMYGGIITFLFLFSAALIPILNKKGVTKIPFIWHSRLATVFLILGLIHALLGILLFF
jgi:hypothetical protein